MAGLAELSPVVFVNFVVQLHSGMIPMKILKVVLLVFACGAFQSALGQGPKEEILRDVSRGREKLMEGIHVQYSVRQAVVDETARFGIVHFGSSSDGSSLLPFWHAEHAVAGDREFHRASKQPEEYEEADRVFVYDRTYYYSLLRATQVANAYLKADHNAYDLPLDASPVEELYWELIGIRSRSAGKGNGRVTLAGNNNVPFDLLDVLKDDSYVLKSNSDVSDGELIEIECAGVDKISLNAAFGFAITKRDRNWADSDKPMMKLENSDFEQVADNAWIPRKSEITYFPKPDNDRAGSEAVVAKLTVDLISRNPPDSLFVPDVTQIIQVMDLTHHADGKVSVKPVFINELAGKNLSDFLQTARRSVGPAPR